MVSATSIEHRSGSDDFAHLAVSAYQLANPANHQTNRANDADVEHVTAIIDVVPLMLVDLVISALCTQTVPHWRADVEKHRMCTGSTSTVTNVTSQPKQFGYQPLYVSRYLPEHLVSQITGDAAEFIDSLSQIPHIAFARPSGAVGRSVRQRNEDVALRNA